MGTFEYISWEDQLTIVPNGYTIITKLKAQDRTVPAVHILQKNKKVKAYCVQSSQSGLMDGNHTEDNKELRFSLKLFLPKAFFT